MRNHSDALDLALKAALVLAGLFPLALAIALLVAAFLGPAAAAEESASCEGRNLLAAIAKDDPARLAQIEAEAGAVPNGRGKLFRVEKDGVDPSWLFGTMHVADPRVLSIGERAEAAFGRSDRLVIETTDILDEAAMAATLLSRPDLVNLPRGETIEDYLEPVEEARVRAALEDRGIPFAAIRTLQPWFSAMSLLLPECLAAQKTQGEAVLDVKLAKMAKSAGKTTQGLESGIEQMEAVASLPMALQADNLVATLALGERMPDILETMTALYLEGRIGMISPMIEHLAPMGGEDASSASAYAAFERRVVVERNRTMADRLAPLLAKGGNFVAVGALHLPGEAGLVALLREKGWTVTRADGKGSDTL